jgi:hypothetical protein
LVIPGAITLALSGHQNMKGRRAEYGHFGHVPQQNMLRYVSDGSTSDENCNRADPQAAPSQPASKTRAPQQEATLLA